MYDKSAVLIVLGVLIQKPSLLLDRKYHISDKDFAERFHKIVFGAINNLFSQGVKIITPIEIDTYLSNYSTQKKIFDDNNGIEYIENLTKISLAENFDYYYNILKKYTLLRELKEQGFEVTSFFDDSIVDPSKEQKMKEKFDNLSVQDILQEVEKKITSIKNNFYFSDSNEECKIGEDLFSLKERLKLTPEMGLPLGGKILNTICRGSRRKALYLKSHPSGYFKTRSMVEEACNVSIPYYYDTVDNAWKYRGYKEPTLFITTELEIEEIATMIMANISGVDESHILDGRYTVDEEKRINMAIDYIKAADLYLVHLPNFSIAEVDNVIRSYQMLHGVTYVYFDYIFTSLKMVAELSAQSKGMRLREDNLLLAFSTHLKDLCNELDIHITTATQVTDGWQTGRSPDSSLIKSCKAIAD